jgi:signal transduction histidine kinase
MEKRLRIKFIGVAMLAVTVVLTCMIGAINGINYYNVCSQADARLQLLSQNNGAFPESMGSSAAENGLPGGEVQQNGTSSAALEKEQGANKTAQQATVAAWAYGGGGEAKDPGDDRGMSAETPFESRYFTVTLSENGTVMAENVQQIAAVSAAQAEQFARDVMQSGAQSGFAQQYRFAVSPLGNGQAMYLFLDCSRDLGNFESFLMASVLISIVGWLLVLILVTVLSRIVIRPIVESYEKQKAFVTDASHEIKTPLAVISASNEVQEMENGETEWTRIINEQVQRLAALTERLVTLARMDEGKDAFQMEAVNISQVVSDAAEPFETVAVQRGKNLVQNVEPNIECRGDGAALSQMAELLLDNAMRYSSEGSEVTLGLHRVGRKVELTVANGVDNLPKGNLDKLFERFYRDDSSRSSETGGTGVGLSVVRGIAEAHGGTAHASANGNVITFTVRL